MPMSTPAPRAAPDLAPCEGVGHRPALGQAVPPQPRLSHPSPRLLPLATIPPGFLETAAPLGTVRGQPQDGRGTWDKEQRLPRGHLHTVSLRPQTQKDTHSVPPQPPAPQERPVRPGLTATLYD